MADARDDQTNDRYDPDDLTLIRGIGETRQQWFRETFDVSTFQDMAALSVEAIESQFRAEGRPIQRQVIEEWLAEAAQLAETVAVESLPPSGQTQASDAVAAARGNALSKMAYRTGYYLSYGVVYSSLFVASVVPTDNALGAGLRDGTEAAKDAVQQRAERRAARRAIREIEEAADELADELEEGLASA